MKRFFQRLFRKPLRKAIRILDEKSRNRSTAAKAEQAFNRWVSDKKYTEPTESTEIPLSEMGLTSGELSYFCKSRYGKTFLTVRKELRIKEACRLILEHPDSKISEIGTMVGFSEPSNFRHQFKSVEGITPSEWRDSHKKIQE